MNGGYLKSRKVFSTLVEVFPLYSSPPDRPAGLLHARGGVSGSAGATDSTLASSPRSWRCFSYYYVLLKSWGVFSTLVEVFLANQRDNAYHASLLHARGGVSFPLIRFVRIGASSPRSWRCFNWIGQ